MSWSLFSFLWKSDSIFFRVGFALFEEKTENWTFWLCFYKKTKESKQLFLKEWRESDSLLLLFLKEWQERKEIFALLIRANDFLF